MKYNNDKGTKGNILDVISELNKLRKELEALKAPKPKQKIKDSDD